LFTGADGTPIAGAKVTVTEVVPGWTQQIAAFVTTNRRGTFTYRTRGGPSRALIFQSFGISAAVLVAVRGHVVVHMPRAVRVGQRARIWGQVTGGYIPAWGVTIRLQYRVVGVGGPWIAFARAFRCNAKGRWAISAGRWQAGSGGATYQVRAVISSGQPGWPFAGAVSAAVTRYVTP
jgi:hypothetical protein